MQYSVRFYSTLDDAKPMADFLHDVQTKEPVLYKLLLAGIKKLEHSDFHGPPFTEQVDKDNHIFELRVGHTNIARAFFFFRRGQEIIVTNGYVKKKQKLDSGELQKARAYKRDWEARYP